MKITLFFLITILFIASCAVTGPGGKTSLILIPTESEVQIGKEVAADVESKETVLANQTVQDYVNAVGQKVVKVCDRKNIKYSFKVLESDEINAFACPGGFIYVYSGLLKEFDNEAQLSAVLAHEVGHVVARHSIKRLQTVYGYTLVMEIALGPKMGKTARAVVDGAAGLILQGYGRENEYEADDYGALYSKKAGYNPKGMIEVFQKFKKMEGSKPSSFEKLFLSHPPADDRIKNANAQISKIGGTDLPYGESEYKEMLETLK